MDFKNTVLADANPASAGGGLDQAEFDRLLEWLDPDRQRAGEKYESIRRKLIKIFVTRGCTISDELADRTIDRVARRLPHIQKDYQGNPAHYFYGVARLILLESTRNSRLSTVLPDRLAPPVEHAEEDERDYEVLLQCLNALAETDRALVIRYYREDKKAKIDHRKQLAQELGLTMNALRIRAYRIRARLKRRKPEGSERC
jgi:DNA-directed RNA polymerase specialized sigma24 family protein